MGEAVDGLGGGQGVEPAEAGGAAGLRGEVADQAEPGQAAVGVGVEADGGDGVLVLAGELVAGVGLQAGAGQEGRPGPGGFVRVLRGVVAGLAVELGLGGGVVFEVGGVEDDAADYAGEGELDDHVVVTLVAAAAGLPAFAHGAGLVGADQVGGGGVEVVAGGHDGSAVLLAGQVDGQGFQPAGVGDGVAEDAEAGDAAVGVGGQAQVGEAAGVGDPEAVVAVAG